MPGKLIPQIGLQLFSVRDELERDAPGTLEKIAAIGYENLELISRETDEGLLFPGRMLPAELHRHLERLGLSAIGCHFMPQEEMNLDRILNSFLEVGVSSLVMPFAAFTERQATLDYAQQVNHIAEACIKKDIQLHYHNHFQEFQIFDGKTAMDLLFENTERDLVKFELDIYWALRGGQDPIAWLQKLGPRCDRLHLKDLPAGISPVNLIDLIAREPSRAVMDLFQNVGKDQFTEIGSGTIDFTKILEAAYLLGNLRYGIVEQDQTAKTELESVAVSYKNMKRLLKIVKGDTP